MFTTEDDVVPESTLYKPLIVSPDRYEELENQGLVDGYIVIDVQASDSTLAQGIDSSKMTIIEKGLYSTKIPLADTFGGFNYPIKSVIAYEMDGDRAIDSHLLTTSDYTLDVGNLYFHESLEELVSSPDNYLKFVIQIAKIIPDDGSEEIRRDALNIATTYTIMDYFDQYTFAQTTAQMIAEIGYTETMTVTSMAISAPFIALGSYAVGAYIEASAIASTAAQKLIADTAQKSLVKTIASQFALKPLLYQVGKQVVIGTIKETIEEIVVDGFFETAIQSAVRMVGGPDDMGHWISTLFTSARESMNFASLTGISTQSQQQGFAGQVQTAMDQNAEFLASVMNLKLQYEDDVSIAQVATVNEQFLTAKMNEFGVLESSIQESKISLGRLLATGIFTGLAMLTPSLAGFNLYGMSKLIGGIGGKIDGKIQNKFLAARNAKMLGKYAQELEKQEVEIGMKPIASPSEDNLPNAKTQVSTMPSIPYPSTEPTPVEAAVSETGGYYIYTPMDTSGNIRYDKGYDYTGITFIKDKQARIEQNQEELEELVNSELVFEGILMKMVQVLERTAKEREFYNLLDALFHPNRESMGSKWDTTEGEYLNHIRDEDVFTDIYNIKEFKLVKKELDYIKSDEFQLRKSYRIDNLDQLNELLNKIGNKKNYLVYRFINKESRFERQGETVNFKQRLSSYITASKNPGTHPFHSDIFKALTLNDHIGKWERFYIKTNKLDSDFFSNYHVEIWVCDSKIEMHSTELFNTWY